MNLVRGVLYSMPTDSFVSWGLCLLRYRDIYQYNRFHTCRPSAFLTLKVQQAWNTVSSKFHPPDLLNNSKLSQATFKLGLGK